MTKILHIMFRSVSVEQEFSNELQRGRASPGSVEFIHIRANQDTRSNGRCIGSQEIVRTVGAGMPVVVRGRVMNNVKATESPRYSQLRGESLARDDRVTQLSVANYRHSHCVCVHTKQMNRGATRLRIN